MIEHEGGDAYLHRHKPPWKVKLTYFKPSGKYYSEGEYESKKLNPFEIYEEVKGMDDVGVRPGLITGISGGYYNILIELPDHPLGVPHLIPSKGE